MFVYQKKLQFPVKIENTDPKLASIIISQYGGPNGNCSKQKTSCPGFFTGQDGGIRTLF